MLHEPSGQDMRCGLGRGREDMRGGLGREREDMRCGLARGLRQGDQHGSRLGFALRGIHMYQVLIDASRPSHRLARKRMLQRQIRTSKCSSSGLETFDI